MALPTVIVKDDGAGRLGLLLLIPIGNLVNQMVVGEKIVQTIVKRNATRAIVVGMIDLVRFQLDMFVKKI